jgi:hypothetical protein
MITKIKAGMVFKYSGERPSMFYPFMKIHSIIDGVGTYGFGNSPDLCDVTGSSFRIESGIHINYYTPLEAWAVEETLEKYDSNP